MEFYLKYAGQSNLIGIFKRKIVQTAHSIYYLDQLILKCDIIQKNINKFNGSFIENVKNGLK